MGIRIGPALAGGVGGFMQGYGFVEGIKDRRDEREREAEAFELRKQALESEIRWREARTQAEQQEAALAQRAAALRDQSRASLDALRGLGGAGEAPMVTPAATSRLGLQPRQDFPLWTDDPVRRELFFKLSDEDRDRYVEDQEFLQAQAVEQAERSYVETAIGRLKQKAAAGLLPLTPEQIDEAYQLGHAQGGLPGAAKAVQDLATTAQKEMRMQAGLARVDGLLTQLYQQATAPDAMDSIENPKLDALERLQIEAMKARTPEDLERINMIASIYMGGHGPAFEREMQKFNAKMEAASRQQDRDHITDSVIGTGAAAQAPAAAPSPARNGQPQGAKTWEGLAPQKRRALTLQLAQAPTDAEVQAILDREGIPNTPEVAEAVAQAILSPEALDGEGEGPGLGGKFSAWQEKPGEERLADILGAPGAVKRKARQFEEKLLGASAEAAAGIKAEARALYEELASRGREKGDAVMKLLEWIGRSPAGARVTGTPVQATDEERRSQLRALGFGPQEEPGPLPPRGSSPQEQAEESGPRNRRAGRQESPSAARKRATNPDMSLVELLDALNDSLERLNEMAPNGR